MDVIQNEDYAPDSCAISPAAFLLTVERGRVYTKRQRHASRNFTLDT